MCLCIQDNKYKTRRTAFFYPLVLFFIKMKNSENIYLSNNPPILSHSKHRLLLMKEAVPDVPTLFLKFQGPFTVWHTQLICDAMENGPWEFAGKLGCREFLWESSKCQQAMDKEGNQGFITYKCPNKCQSRFIR